MLIKNNKIIVRKCRKNLFEETLNTMGYEKLMADGKTLIVPFHVFDEVDLFQNLKEANIKFYAVPLNDDHHYLLTTDNYSLLSTCNFFEKGEFLNNTDFTNTIELIRLLSYQCENPKECTYEKLLKELKFVVKNPSQDYLNVDFERVGKYLTDNVDKLNEKERGLIIELEKSLGIEFSSISGEEFLKSCLVHFVYEGLLETYEKADLVFWYNALPASSRGQDINN